MLVSVPKWPNGDALALYEMKEEQGMDSLMYSSELMDFPLTSWVAPRLECVVQYVS